MTAAGNLPQAVAEQSRRVIGVTKVQQVAEHHSEDRGARATSIRVVGKVRHRTRAAPLANAGRRANRASRQQFIDSLTNLARLKNWLGQQPQVHGGKTQHDGALWVWNGQRLFARGRALEASQKQQ
jgi:hypothetical protein